MEHEDMVKWHKIVNGPDHPSQKNLPKGPPAMKSEIIEDKREIIRVTPNERGDPDDYWVANEEIRFVTYEEPGLHGGIPFIKILMHEQVLCRVSALAVEIQYRVERPA